MCERFLRWVYDVGIHAIALIAQTIREQSIDLLVMGAYAHSPLRSLLFGGMTNTMLGSSNIPTLLMR